MSADGCLTDEDLAELASGAAAEERLDGIAAHLDGCPSCRARWSALAAEPAGAEAAAAGPIASDAIAEAALRAHRTARIRRLWRVAMAAAAALVLGFALPSFWSTLPEPARPRWIPEGKTVRGVDEAVETAAAAEPLRLPDGSRLRLLPGTRARFLAPGPGERFHLHLDRGALEAEVEPSRKAFRISAEAGEIRVLGTRFTARALRIHPDAPALPRPCLAVEVEEGAVRLESPSGAVRVPAGKRGLARAGSAPLVQELKRLGWREAVSRWARSHASPAFAESIEAATLLAGGWKGLDSWLAASADASAPAEARRAAASLAALQMEAEDAPLLSARWRAQADPSIRVRWVPVLARILGDGASQELSRIAREDPDPAVRARAEGVLREAGDD